MNTNPERMRPPIAIVGVSALFPGSSDATGFWKDILAGTDRITPVPPTHWLIDDYFDPDLTAPDKTYGRRGGFLETVDLDAMGFGVPPNLVPSTDTAQLLALIVAQQVLDDAIRCQFSELDRSRVSVILGVTSGQELLGAMASRLSRPLWLQGMRRAGVPEDVAVAACAEIANLHPSWTESTFPGLLGNVVAGRIANRLDLGGTNCVTDAACASSFSAISMGVNELYLGDSDLVIAGGVDTMNDILMYMCFSKTPALSRTEDVRPFSDRADGTMLGEGIGMFALKRLDDAEREGNAIYCIIDGVGASSDGRAKSVYAPVAAGQARALDSTYAKAGYGPDTVELVEAHGTGTVAGDAAEFTGLEMVFGATGREDRQWCALGSVKSQIGHTKSAAGAAGLFKVVMALHHKVLPQTAKIDRPNPELDLVNSPFHLNTRTRPWVRGSDHARRGAVSSFGFGGSNFHIAVSEYLGAGAHAPRLRTGEPELVVLTGADGAAVAEDARHRIDNATTAGYLAWLAHSSQCDYRADAPARLAVVATDESDLRAQLAQAAERLDAKPDAAFTLPGGTSFGCGPHVGDVAFVFPGQGSQYVSMGADLAMGFGDAMAAWDVAADVYRGSMSLHDVVFPIATFADEERQINDARLTRTEWAQPALAATSMSMLRLLRAAGVEARHVAGHSFGEIVALHAAGVFSDADVIRVARRRGELMAEAAAATEGSMIAVSSPVEVVRAVVAESGADVVVANHNSPSQAALSGPTAAIEQVEQTLATHGIAFKRLPVATAFHSPVVSGASTAFTEFLDTVQFNPSTIAVHANETAEQYPADDLTAIRSQLGRQLARPVRFVEMIEAMYAKGARTFVEVGPSAVLTGLVGSILEGREHRAIAMDKKNKGGLGAFLCGLGQLAAAGVAMDLSGLWSEYAEMANPHERVKPKLTIPITGANYGKPYPPHDLSEIVGPNPVAATTPGATVRNGEPAVSANGASAGHVVEAAPAVVDAAPLVPVAAVASPVAAAAVEAVPFVREERIVSPPTEVLAVFQAVQQQTADAHSVYLTSMGQAHSTFLDAAQQSLDVIARIVGVPQRSAPAAPSAATPSAVTNAPSLRAPAVDIVAPPAPVEPPHFAPQQPPVPAAPPTVAAPVQSSTSPGSLSFDDLMALLLAVVADRTGYPAEMLSMGMELESDLGIDSIKRVEILSAMQDEVAGLPALDTTVMAELVTLGQIVEYLAGQLGAPDVGTSESVSMPASVSVSDTSVVASPGSLSFDDLMALLLAVVADRTGYPAEMLSMGMELESDLGIDSIKRVEILSAMQDEVAGLPALDTTVMAELVTLGQIVEYLAGQLGAPDAAANAAPEVQMPVQAPAAFGRLVTHAVETPSTGTATIEPGDGRIAVIDDGDGIAKALVEILAESGVAADVVDAVTDGEYAGAVLLGGLRDVADIDEALAVNAEAFRTARTVGSSLRAFVTCTDLGGSFGCDGVDELRAWTAGVTALTRTAAIEWPATRVRAIDIERGGRPPDEIARAIADELLHGGAELEVGLRADGTRVTLRSTAAAADCGTVSVGPDDVIVVSGGGRGVTAAAMIELARASKARFVLLGRSTLADEPPICAGAPDDAALKRVLLDAATAEGRTTSPAELGRTASGILANREIRGTIAAIEQAGGEAHYVSVDVTDATALSNALDVIRTDVGPITGIIHGAGVLADKRIVDKTDEQFQAVFDTKVGGLRTLLAATADDPLQLLCFFSSVAARTGNEGQADYAMANEILNKVAVAERARRGAACVVKSCGWGPWAGGMVGPALQERFETMGVAVIPLDVGARMFVDEIASPQTDQVEVVLGSLMSHAATPPSVDHRPPS